MPRPTAGPAPRRTRARAALRRGAPLLLAAGLAGGHFASFEPLTRPLVTDVRYFVYYAWRVTQGDVPHRDLFAVKTQLATFAGAGLHALGEVLGADPLLAIRTGYLGLAGLGALLAFRVHQRLGGSAACGFLGLFAYLGFGLLGELPAIGNVPKLAMAVLASATALLCRAGRFGAAGAAAALAFLDWQIGALAWLGALLAAGLASGSQLRAVGRVILGGALALAPFALYYAWAGALGDTLEQVFWASLQRGGDELAVPASRPPVERIASSLPWICPEQEWLFWAALPGAVVVAAELWRRRRSPERLLLAPLAVFHYGIAGFSLVDLQGYGDFMALLHSAAFFAAASGRALFHAALAGAGRALPPAWRGRGARRALAWVLLVLAGLAARPGPLRPTLELRAANAAPGATLADQRHVAAAAGRALAGRSVAALDGAELLFLMRVANRLPAPYLNPAVWRAFRRGDERMVETGERLVLAAHPGAVLLPRRMVVRGALLAEFEPRRLVSPTRRYAVVLRLRRAPTLH